MNNLEVAINFTAVHASLTGEESLEVVTPCALKRDTVIGMLYKPNSREQAVTKGWMKILTGDSASGVSPLWIYIIETARQ